MAGFLDFLFQGSPPPSVTSNTTSTTAAPDWLQEYVKADLAKGNAVASQDYQSYGGPRVAPLTTAQNTAYSNIASQQGNWQPGLQQAQQQTTAASNPALNQGDFNSYLSPYLSGVTDQIATLGARNLSENLLPQVNQTFTGAGQWGSSRNAQFTGNAVRDTQQGILGQQALALQQGYDSAMSNYQTGQNRALAGGAQTGALAQQQQQQQLQDAAALEASGQAQQGQTQKNLDQAYQDFTEQRDYTKNNVNWLSGLINGQAGTAGTTTNTSSTGPGSNFSPSPLATIAGTYSLLKGLRKGGMVDKGREQVRRRMSALQMLARGGMVYA